MQTRIYNGPHPEVAVALEQPLEDGTREIIAVRGEPKEFPDTLAERLDDQGETWLHADGDSNDTKVAIPELRARLKEAGVTAPRKATKVQLEQLLEEHMQSLITDGNAGDGETTQGATADAHTQEPDSSDSSDTAAGGEKE